MPERGSVLIDMERRGLRRWNGDRHRRRVDLGEGRLHGLAKLIHLLVRVQAVGDGIGDLKARAQRLWPVGVRDRKGAKLIDLPGV